MGITNNAEEFLLRILNFEIVFEFAEKTDYLFLYKIKVHQTFGMSGGCISFRNSKLYGFVYAGNIKNDYQP